MNTTRRDFVKLGSSLPLAGWMAGAARSADAKELPIVDTHQHLWDLTKFKPPWLKGAPEVLSRSYVTGDYLAATKGLNLAKAVYMEVDVHPRQQVEEAEHVIALSKSVDHPTVAAVISGRPNEESFANYITRYKNSPYVKGVRQVLHVDSAPRGLCLGTQFVQSMRLLGELGKSFDLCMRPTELSDGFRLAKECPETRFIVDHCGNADPKAWLDATDQEPWHQVDQWKRDLDRLAGCPNVICKISGIVARAPAVWKPEQLAPIINFCLLQFGPDRVVFGGDWPVCLLRSSFVNWVSALKEVVQERPSGEQRKLLHDNAIAFYQL